jgi:hypothetical protein
MKMLLKIVCKRKEEIKKLVSFLTLNFSHQLKECLLVFNLKNLKEFLKKVKQHWQNQIPTTLCPMLRSVCLKEVITLLCNICPKDLIENQQVILMETHVGQQFEQVKE